MPSADKQRGYRDTRPAAECAREAERVLKKFPDSVPVVVEVAPGRDPVELTRRKFLVPRDLTAGQFMGVLRRRIKIAPTAALFLLIDRRTPDNKPVGQVMPPCAATMGAVYEEHRDENGL